MTSNELRVAIDCQKQIVAERPYDTDERIVLDALYTALRKTFHVVKNDESPQYVYSPSRAVLKRV